MIVGTVFLTMQAIRLCKNDLVWYNLVTKGIAHYRGGYMKKVLTVILAGVLSVVFVAGCGKDNGNNPLPYGVIKGRIMGSSDSSGIASANVIAYDATTNAPITRTYSDELLSESRGAGVFSVSPP